MYYRVRKTGQPNCEDTGYILCVILRASPKGRLRYHMLLKRMIELGFSQKEVDDNLDALKENGKIFEEEKGVRIV